MAGYQKSRTDTSPPDPVRLEVVDDQRGAFALVTPFAYVDEAGDVHAVPEGETDLTSVPWPLRGLIGSYGRHLRAALLHDHECKQANAMPRPERYAARRLADDVFREALRLQGSDPKQRVSRVRTQILWAGVSMAREWKFRRSHATVMGVQVLTGTIGVYVAAARRDPRWLLVYALMIVLASAWGRDAGFVAVATAVTPVVLPPFVVTAAAALLLAAAEVPAWLRDRQGEPSPDPRPTLNVGGGPVAH